MKSPRHFDRVLAKRSATGVTLIELLIAVAIVGILAAIAYPSYQRQVARTNRNAAKACLSEYAQFMERYYTTRLTYVGAVPLLGCRGDSGMDQRYTFSGIVPLPTQSTYRVTATPIGAQATRDAECGVLSINELGVRDASGATGPACW